MKVEKTEIWIACERPIEGDGTALRGFFGNMYCNRPEFHGHRGDELIYKHPLIQYKVFGGSALVVGLKEGAYLLKAIPKLQYLEIHHRKYSVIKQDINAEVIPFGLTTDTISYSFATPWIALNEENYKSYLIMRTVPQEANLFLEKILIGNILSMSKSIGYVVKERIYVKLKPKEDEVIQVKNNVKLISFQGEFQTNFIIPDFWGIGKFSSRGYGTVKRN